MIRTAPSKKMRYDALIELLPTVHIAGTYNFRVTKEPSPNINRYIYMYIYIYIYLYVLLKTRLFQKTKRFSRLAYSILSGWRHASE